VYRSASNMKTARPAHPSNVVNVSVTIVSQILPSAVGREAPAI
jgi:hypothetical protein